MRSKRYGIALLVGLVLGASVGLRGTGSTYGGGSSISCAANGIPYAITTDTLGCGPTLTFNPTSKRLLIDRETGDGVGSAVDVYNATGQGVSITAELASGSASNIKAVEATAGTGGAVTDLFGVLIDSSYTFGGGAADNNYGLYIGNQSGVGGMTNYAIYYAAPSSKTFAVDATGELYLKAQKCTAGTTAPLLIDENGKITKGACS